MSKKQSAVGGPYKTQEYKPSQLISFDEVSEKKNDKNLPSLVEKRPPYWVFKFSAGHLRKRYLCYAFQRSSFSRRVAQKAAREPITYSFTDCLAHVPRLAKNGQLCDNIKVKNGGRFCL